MKSTSSPTPRAWDRLPNERSRPYRAFCIFRDLGPDRSQDKAYELAHKDSIRRSGDWSKLSIKNNWVERAEAYDDWIDEEKRAATAERIRKLEERRRLFAEENQERMENQVRSMDLVLENAFKTPLSKITQTKIDKVAGTKTVTEVGELDLGGCAKFAAERNNTAELAIKGVDAKEPEEEERKIDRIVWVNAPKKADPPKDPDPDMLDHSGPGNVQPITELIDDFPEDEPGEDLKKVA